MKIAVLDDYQDALRSAKEFPLLAGHQVTAFTHAFSTSEAMIAALKEMDAIVLIQQRTPMSAAVINALPKLRFISQTGRNVGHLDLDALRARGIVISAGGHGGPNATAELAWALILAACRHIPEEVAALKAGGWQTTTGIGLHGKTLGIYSYGRIGALVARVGKAFGMRIVCWGREASLARAVADGFEAAVSKEAFFAEADILSLHLLGTPETRGIVKAGDLALMKPNALIVNTSRAALFEPGALLEALKKGRPGHAAIDVFDKEPAAGDPLISMPNVTATPHLGYVEEANYANLFGTAINQLAAFIDGKPINLL